MSRGHDRGQPGRQGEFGRGRDNTIGARVLDWIEQTHGRSARLLRSAGSTPMDVKDRRSGTKCGVAVPMDRPFRSSS